MSGPAVHPPVLLQLSDFAPEVQAGLDADFYCLRADDIERDPDAAARIRGLVMRSNQQLDDDLLARLPNLEIIATFGVLATTMARFAARSSGTPS